MEFDWAEEDVGQLNVDSMLVVWFEFGEIDVSGH
jgi:hypothetical protein